MPEPLPVAGWPPFLTPPADLLPWLEQETQRRTPEGFEVFKHLLSLRGLVLAELARAAPAAQPQ
jgi:hypothetical protein